MLAGNVAANNRGSADALRFAPVRSSGFRMPGRERAVQLIGVGEVHRRAAEPCRSVDRNSANARTALQADAGAGDI